MSAEPTVPDPHRRALQTAAAGLGGVAFLVGFLPFYSTGNNGISGYALGTPTSAAIGFSVLAGLLVAAELIVPRTPPGPVAAPAASDRRVVDPSAQPPLSLAAGLTALLLALANLVAKGSLSGDVSFGFVLFLLDLLAQSAVLGYLWLLSTGRISAPGARGAAGKPPGGGYGQPGQFSSAQPSWSGVTGTSDQVRLGPVYGPFYPPAPTGPPPANGFGQPLYGQPAYGQPAHGQPAHGQPAHGQPAYGQPAYGQPPYAAPPYGQPSFGQPSFEQFAAEPRGVPGPATFGPATALRAPEQPGPQPGPGSSAPPGRHR